MFTVSQIQEELDDVLLEVERDSKEILAKQFIEPADLRRYFDRWDEIQFRANRLLLAVSRVYAEKKRALETAMRETINSKSNRYFSEHGAFQERLAKYEAANLHLVVSVHKYEDLKNELESFKKTMLDKIRWLDGRRMVALSQARTEAYTSQKEY